MTKEAIDKNPVIKLAFEFSIEIISFSETLEAQKKYLLARQLMRSGTSIGANIIEAQNAESMADFIHKFKISAKEAEETEYWLLLCKHSRGYPDPGELMGKIVSLNKMIGKIISTCKKSKKKLH